MTPFAATITPPVDLPAAPPAGVAFDVALDRYHTMGLACRAWAFAEATSREHLADLVRWARSCGKAWRVLGGGSNVLFVRDVVDLLVIRLGRGLGAIDVEVERGVVRCGAAALWRPLIKAARDLGFGGLEYGWCIPGTIGGALAGNAGAAGRAVCEDVVRVRALDPATLEEVVIPSTAISYGYRRSSLRDVIVLEAELGLEVTPPDIIDRRLEEMRAMRKAQPVGVKSSGCVFKNPDGCSAGRLIDELGLKGLAVGDAVVSGVHGNFLVNRGHARPGEMLALIDEVRRRVAAGRGIELEVEVRLVGAGEEAPSATAST